MHFGRKIATVSIGNRAILRRIGRDFGAHHARIACKTRAIIAGSRCTLFGGVLDQKFDRAMRSARKIEKTFHENRTRFRWFLQSFGVRQARRECATQEEVFLDVLQVM